MRETKENPGGKLLSRDVVLVMTAGFCYMACSMIGISLTAGFAAELGASPSATGAIAASMSFISLFCRPFAGILSDKFSKRAVAWGSSSLILAANIGCSFAKTPLFLTICRTVNGVGFSVISVCIATWMTMMIPISRMGTGMGLYGTINALAMAIGPAAAIKIQSSFGYRASFAFAAALIFAETLIVMFIKNGGSPVGKTAGQTAAGKAKTSSPLANSDQNPNQNPNHDSYQDSYHDSYQTSNQKTAKKIRKPAFLIPNVIEAALIFMIFSVPYFSTQAFVVTYIAAKHSPADAGLFFPCYAITLLLIRIFFRNAFDRHSFTFFVFACGFSMIASLLFLNSAANSAILAVGAFFMACAYGVMSSVTQSKMIEFAGIEHSGQANSTYYIAVDFGMIIGPFITGLIYGSAGIDRIYPILVAIIPAAMIVHFAFVNSGSKKA